MYVYVCVCVEIMILSPEPQAGKSHLMRVGKLQSHSDKEINCLRYTPLTTQYVKLKTPSGNIIYHTPKNTLEN